MTTPTSARTGTIRAKISALGTSFRLVFSPMPTWKKWSIRIMTGFLPASAFANAILSKKGMATSDLAVEAAKKALAQRGLTPNDIDAIIVGTVTPDMFFPSTACLVQHKLGATRVWGFDLSAACSAFIYAVQTGAQFIAAALIDDFS